ncbi:cephalotocin receptor 1-like [Tubulanus polymorphus]|uniref:cephalotocin receptor 1-like n=1 Tax=Tubulanus polymorphus TaxID=672921 RepID=UPI003DA40BC1
MDSTALGSEKVFELSAQNRGGNVTASGGYVVIADCGGNCTATTPNSTSTPLNGDNLDHLYRIETSLLAVVFTLAVVGNTAVIVAIFGRKKKIGRMFLFILHLSFADIMVAFFNILSQLLIKTLGPYGTLTIPSNGFCKFVMYMQLLPLYASSYILVMTAIDRYIAICHPLRNYKWTTKRCHVMVASAWLIASLLSLPQLFIFRFQKGSTLPPHDYCRDQFHLWPAWIVAFYTISTAVFIFIIPLIIISFMYGFISVAVWRNAYLKKSSMNPKPWRTAADTGRATSASPGDSNRTDMAPRTHSKRSFSRAKLKTVLLTLVVIIAFVCCWTPFYACMIWWSFDPPAATANGFTVIVFMSNLNSCCNPWIYMAFSGSLVSKLFPKCRKYRKNCDGCTTQGRNSMYSKCDTEFSTLSTGKKNRVFRQNNYYELATLNAAAKRLESETCSLIMGDCFAKKKNPAAKLLEDFALSSTGEKQPLRRQKSMSDSDISLSSPTKNGSAACSHRQVLKIPTIKINGECARVENGARNNDLSVNMSRSSSANIYSS